MEFLKYARPEEKLMAILWVVWTMFVFIIGFGIGYITSPDPEIMYDLNQDGIVNLQDLSILMGHLEE